MKISVPPAAPATSPQEPAPDASPIAGFWRRTGAALLDFAVLGGVGFVLGLCFARQFMAWGSWGRLLGFAIALLYWPLGALFVLGVPAAILVAYARALDDDEADDPVR